jgi:ferredoxin
MIEEVKNRVKELLVSGRIKGFLGIRRRNGNMGPHLFCSGDDLNGLSLGDLNRPGDTRYPLNKFLTRIAARYPEETFGVLVRGCDERGINALFTWNQLKPEKVVMVGIACPEELADACECLKPYPEECTAGKKVREGVRRSVEKIESLEPKGRLDFWLKEFDRCIKCYGCRDVCPMCFCKECSLESADLIFTGEIPPENPVFHLTRAVHMAGRCVDCGLCEEACPADIPLRTLYKKVADIIDGEFGYRPGYKPFEKSPLNVLGGAPKE